MVKPKKLLVEGAVDKRVIVDLVKPQVVDWEIDGNPIVYIDDRGGLPEILRTGVIEAELRASELKALGVIVDANGNAAQRWQQIRERCKLEFPKLPARIPSEGLIVNHKDGLRFGVWIMPDNQRGGMLEDFLVSLIPEDGRDLLELAKKCVFKAKEIGAPFQEVHRTKAELHTWLAWQDKPGSQLHVAVQRRVLVPDRPEFSKFIAWFQKLFEI